MHASLIQLDISSTPILARPLALEDRHHTEHQARIMLAESETTRTGVGTLSFSQFNMTAARRAGCTSFEVLGTSCEGLAITDLLTHPEWLPHTKQAPSKLQQITYLNSIEIDPQHQRKGYARAAVFTLLSHLLHNHNVAVLRAYPLTHISHGLDPRQLRKKVVALKNMYDSLGFREFIDTDYMAVTLKRLKAPNELLT